MTAKHTQTRLEYVPSTKHHGPYLTTEHGSTVADLYVMSQPGELSTASGGLSEPLPFLAEMADPNAARLALCWNMHDEMVDLLRTARAFREPTPEWVERAATVLDKIDGAK